MVILSLQASQREGPQKVEMDFKDKSRWFSKSQGNIPVPKSVLQVDANLKALAGW
jgi:hypothetical protein